MIHSVCALLGERASLQSPPSYKDQSIKPQIKYISDPALSLAQFHQQSQMSDSDSGATDDEDDERAKEIERKKSKLAATSSHLGLTREQQSAAQATRRVITGRGPNQTT